MPRVAQNDSLIDPMDSHESVPITEKENMGAWEEVLS
jgi:hypothetical protein